MNALQPNFEKIKTALYNVIMDRNKCSKVDTVILLEQVKAKFMLSPFSQRRVEFKNELNNWLNNIDIRTAGTMIDIVVENKGSLPKWMKDKDYVIDYNNNEFLDLIKNETLC